MNKFFPFLLPGLCTWKPSQPETSETFHNFLSSSTPPPASKNSLPYVFEGLFTDSSLKIFSEAKKLFFFEEDLRMKLVET